MCRDPRELNRLRLVCQRSRLAEITNSAGPFRSSQLSRHFYCNEVIATDRSNSVTFGEENEKIFSNFRKQTFIQRQTGLMDINLHFSAERTWKDIIRFRRDIESVLRTLMMRQPFFYIFLNSQF